MILPPGWKSFDLCSNYYDPETRTKSRFATRWFFEAVKRWDKYTTPTQESIVHVSGRLIGRMQSQFPNERMLALLIDTFETIARPVSEVNKVRVSNTGKGSAWKRQRADPRVGPLRHSTRLAGPSSADRPSFSKREVSATPHRSVSEETTPLQATSTSFTERPDAEESVAGSVVPSS